MDKASKNPRAPSVSLEAALELVGKVYEREKLHPVPLEVVAKDLGYSSYNRSGAARRVVASLRYYGLLTSPKTGYLQVSPDVQEYRLNPDATVPQKLRAGWAKTPKIFAEIFEKYPDHLPSEAALKFDLVKQGFSEEAASEVLKIFIPTVVFAKAAESEQQTFSTPPQSSDEVPIPEEANRQTEQRRHTVHPADSSSGELDRIPIRLGHGRRAWLTIPTPFRESDKEIIKRQVDLIVADEIDES